MRFHIFIYITLFLVACSSDPYETGDTSLSYLHADMVDMHVVGQKVESIVTDNDEQLAIASDMKVASSMARVDTTYRVMLYYNKVEGKTIEINGSSSVAVIRPHVNYQSTTQMDLSKPLTLKTDPLTLTSVWRSANGKYLNLSLGLKGGEASDARHKLSFTEDSLKTNIDGTEERYISLRHDQCDIPEFYTSNMYLSIPLSYYTKGTTLHLYINTYKGMETRSFTLP